MIVTEERRRQVDRRRGPERRSTLDRRGRALRGPNAERPVEHVRNALQLLREVALVGELSTGPSEDLGAECFKTVSSPRDGEGVPEIIGARVTVERVGAATQLVVRELTQTTMKRGRRVVLGRTPGEANRREHARSAPQRLRPWRRSAGCLART